MIPAPEVSILTVLFKGFTDLTKDYSDMVPRPLPAPSSIERSRLLSVHATRRRELKSLYERRAAVEALIDCLERYRAVTPAGSGRCIEFTAAEK